MLLVLTDRYRLAIFFFVLSVLIKPHALMLTPAYILFFLVNFSLKKIVVSTLVGFATFLLISFPAFGIDGVSDFFKVLKTNEDRYPYSSLNAFNLWGMDGMLKPDLVEGYLGLTLRTWGNILVGILLVGSATVFYFFLKKSKHRPEIYFLYASICFFAPFITMTGMHERYLFPLFPFLLIYCGLLVFRNDFADYIFYVVVYLLMAIVHFINLFYVYDLNYYTPLSYNGYMAIESRIFHLSLISVIIFSLFYVYSVSKFILVREKNTE